MRILFATNHCHLPDRVGGAESSAHELCLALAAGGATVGMLARRAAPPPPGRGLGGLGRRLAAAARSRRRPPDRGLGYPVFRREEPEAAVAEVVARFRPTAAVVQVGRPLAMARAFLRAGVPTTIYVRDVQFQHLGADGPEGGGLHAEALRGAPVAWLANSQFAAARLREAVGVEATVVSPLVAPERYRVRPRGERVLFVNPVPVKGFDLAARLARSRPDIPFEFLEAWPVFDRLRARWEEALRDAPHVTWSKPVLDMRPAYARARLVLVPSLATRGVWEESWGRVVTEAQVSGIPVLASRSGGLPEAVGPGGLLVEADAPLDDWTKALSRLWDDPHEHAAFARKARAWSERPAIQPETLRARFLTALAR